MSDYGDARQDAVFLIITERWSYFPEVAASDDSRLSSS